LIKKEKYLTCYGSRTKGSQGRRNSPFSIHSCLLHVTKYEYHARVRICTRSLPPPLSLSLSYFVDIRCLLSDLERAK